MGWKPLVVLFGSLFLAVACSGSSIATPSSAPAAESTTTGIAAPTVEAAPQASGTPTAVIEAGPSATVAGDRVSGGRLVRLFVDPPTLDPHLTTDATSAQIIIEVFGGLVTIDPDLKIVPDLAESWDVSQDGRVYTFHLRPNATFHDGKTVTADDVRWSLERATNPLTESPVVDQYLGDIVGVDEKLNGDTQTISGVRVIDDRTIEITIDAPKSYFLAKLTYPTAFVLDRENVEADPKRWFREPNGTGPFMMARYDLGETLLLARHDGYHLGPANLAEVEMILSGGTSMLMYENDEIHITGVGLADLDRLLEKGNPLNSELQQAPPTFSVQYVGMNVNEPPLDDPKVRQALNLAIDKQEIATIVLADQVVPANGILPPGFPGFNDALRGYTFDPVRARQLLAESSYGDDLENMPPITITTPGSFGGSVSLDMEVVLQMWERNLGIRAEFQQTEFATFLKDLHKRRFQMFDIGWIADYPDPENFLDILFYSASSNNHTNYSNPVVDRLLEQARTETDQVARYQLYNRVEQMVIDDAPWIPLWYSGERFVLVKPSVRDYFLTPLYIPSLRYVYLAEE
ncbi:MAG TPA: peptide ABC transporter substrate-binding protein [Dehalococcoidia bacterium]|nr:peptide ABC transporter substrate-binding protein [Dehalococcoidia bacterium]